MKYFLLFFLILNSCEKNYCGDSLRIRVPEKLSEITIYNGENYCTTLENALNEDVQSVNEFSKLVLTNKNLTYQHSIVLVKLIEILGDEKYTDYLVNFNEKDKFFLTAHVMIGLYETKFYLFQSEKLEENFPKLNSFLKGNSPAGAGVPPVTH